MVKHIEWPPYEKWLNSLELFWLEKKKDNSWTEYILHKINSTEKVNREQDCWLSLMIQNPGWNPKKTVGSKWIQAPDSLTAVSSGCWKLNK